MTTLNKFVTQAKTANPQPQHKIINGEQIELTDAEYQTSIEALAAMQLEQQAAEIETQAQIEAQAAKLAARQAVLDKLGLTTDEAAALLG
jgi:hypothetical protein